MVRRRLSLKSFMFKIQKSQMQLCTHEVVQRNKIQGERKKTEVESEYCTPNELIRHAVPWSASLTQQIQNPTWRSTYNFGVGAYLNMKNPGLQLPQSTEYDHSLSSIKEMAAFFVERRCPEVMRNSRQRLFLNQLASSTLFTMLNAVNEVGIKAANSHTIGVFVQN